MLLPYVALGTESNLESISERFSQLIKSIYHRERKNEVDFNTFDLELDDDQSFNWIEYLAELRNRTHLDS